MALNKRKQSDGSKIITMRLDRDTAAYYGKRAKERGMSVSEFLRSMVVQGMIAENAQEIEMRLQAMLAQFETAGGSGGKVALDEKARLSIYTSEALLSAIVQDRDVQRLYDAQNQAQARMKREKGE